MQNFCLLKRLENEKKRDLLSCLLHYSNFKEQISTRIISFLPSKRENETRVEEISRESTFFREDQCFKRKIKQFWEISENRKDEGLANIRAEGFYFANSIMSI
jgi:hypothetical protein